MDKPSESMMFVNQCLDNEIINIIEKMVNYHISGNYNEVRNIILGYNSKTRRWSSKYGENIDKKINTESIPVSAFFSGYIPEGFTKNSGMVFFDDEVYDIVKLHADESVKRILEVLFTLSENVIEYRYIIDIIITEWNTENVKNGISLNKINVDPDVCGAYHWHKIEVREGPWKEFKGTCRSRGIMTRDAFKLAILRFLDNRAEMLKERVR